MNKLAQVLLAFAAPLCLLAADFPEGTGAIEITEPGTYTATEDRTFESLVVATPTGTAESRTVTVFDHTAVPERTISLTGDTNPQFNVLNHYNDIWFKGGIWSLTKDFRLGNDGGAQEGQDAFRRLYVMAGASLETASGLYIAQGQGGSELWLSNATVSAKTVYVQADSALTSTTDAENRGKLMVGAHGRLTATDSVYVQKYYKSTNSKQTGYACVSGEGAEISTKNFYLESAPDTKATVGPQAIVENGGKLVSSGSVFVGSHPYTRHPSYFESLQVRAATFDGYNLYAGYGEGVRNVDVSFSNATVKASGEVDCGYGANSCTNSIVLRDCTDPLFSDVVYVGKGEGSHDNFVGFYNCGTIQLTTKITWNSGKSANSYGNTLLFSNTVVWTDREVAAGGNRTSHDNEVVVAGPQGRVIMATNQRDPVSYGYRNRFRVTDDALLIVSNTSFYAFKNGNDSEIVIERGGQFFGTGKPTSSSFSITLARVTKEGLTSGNSMIVRDGGLISCSGTLVVCGTNNALVVDNGTLTMGNSLTIGDTQQYDDSYPVYGADKCRLVVAGTHPKLNLPRNLMLKADANSILRFEISGNGYSWPDEPTRKAPIVLTGGGSYALTVNDDTVLEADVSKLNASARDTPIAVVSSKNAIVMSETALANANEKGALAKKPYHFSLSDDKKTLFVTAESKGLMLLLR